VFSLGRLQDRGVEAHLFGSRGLFARIGFKATAERLKTEGSKPARRGLLAACIANGDANFVRRV